LSKAVVEKHPALASYYGNLIVNIGKKYVLRLHPEVKRQICRKCKCILVNNVSAKMKIKTKNKSKTVQWECKTCKTTRSFPADKNKDHKIWIEKPDAVIEVIMSLMNEVAVPLSYILTEFFNTCIREGKYPQVLKYVRVSPLYKGKGASTLRAESQDNKPQPTKPVTNPVSKPAGATPRPPSPGQQNNEWNL
ncbi:Ribonuclease P protein subunit p21, partial [Operophtera brumata]